MLFRRSKNNKQNKNVPKIIFREPQVAAKKIEKKPSFIPLRIAKKVLRAKKTVVSTVFDHITGGLWGFCEGVSTGAITASYATKRHGNNHVLGWVIGNVGQAIGTLVGSVTGAISGTTLGFLGGRKEIKLLMKHYREHFGSNRVRVDF